MSAPKSFSDQAIVIKRHNYAEADRIITLFTLRNGKITAIAKGVRKSTSRKAPHIEPFSHTKLFFANTRGMPLITQAETLDNFSHIRENLQSTRLAFHIIEVVDKLFPEGQSQPAVFKEIIKALTFLDSSNLVAQSKQEQVVSHFHLNLLSQLGFGLPNKKDPDSLTHFIEEIIDRRLTAQKHLS